MYSLGICSPKVPTYALIEVLVESILQDMSSLLKKISLSPFPLSVQNPLKILKHSPFLADLKQLVFQFMSQLSHSYTLRRRCCPCAQNLTAGHKQTLHRLRRRRGMIVCYRTITHKWITGKLLQAQQAHHKPIPKITTTQVHPKAKIIQTQAHHLQAHTN